MKIKQGHFSKNLLRKFETNENTNPNLMIKPSFSISRLSYTKSAEIKYEQALAQQEKKKLQKQIKYLREQLRQKRLYEQEKQSEQKIKNRQRLMKKEKEEEEEQQNYQKQSEEYGLALKESIYWLMKIFSKLSMLTIADVKEEIVRQFTSQTKYIKIFKIQQELQTLIKKNQKKIVNETYCLQNKQKKINKSKMINQDIQKKCEQQKKQQNQHINKDNKQTKNNFLNFYNENKKYQKLNKIKKNEKKNTSFYYFQNQNQDLIENKQLQNQKTQINFKQKNQQQNLSKNKKIIKPMSSIFTEDLSLQNWERPQFIDTFDAKKMQSRDIYDLTEQLFKSASRSKQKLQKQISQKKIKTRVIKKLFKDTALKSQESQSINFIMQKNNKQKKAQQQNGEKDEMNVWEKKQKQQTISENFGQIHKIFSTSKLHNLIEEIEIVCEVDLPTEVKAKTSFTPTTAQQNYVPLVKGDTVKLLRKVRENLWIGQVKDVIGYVLSSSIHL